MAFEAGIAREDFPARPKPIINADHDQEGDCRLFEGHNGLCDVCGRKLPPLKTPGHKRTGERTGKLVLMK